MLYKDRFDSEWGVMTLVYRAKAGTLSFFFNTKTCLILLLWKDTQKSLSWDQLFVVMRKMLQKGFYVWDLGGISQGPQWFIKALSTIYTYYCEWRLCESHQRRRPSSWDRHFNNDVNYSCYQLDKLNVKSVYYVCLRSEQRCTRYWPRNSWRQGL